MNDTTLPAVRVTRQQREMVEQRAAAAHNGEGVSLGVYIKRFAMASNFEPGERVVMMRSSLTMEIDERSEYWVCLTNDLNEMEFQCGNDIIIIVREMEDAGVGKVLEGRARLDASAGAVEGRLECFS